MARNKNQDIAYKILKAAGTGALLVTASVLNPVFPYLMLKSYLKKFFREEYNQKQLMSSVQYLKRKKFIAYQNNHFTLTKLGRNYLKRHQVLNELRIKPVPWDGKWRIVSFDIPQDHLAARHVFRKKLKALGFFHFQRSVFLIPYPCEKQIELLAEELGVAKDVHVLVAERFKNDTDIVKKFNLK